MAIDFILAQSDTGAVQVRHVTAFPSGFEFRVVAYAVITEEVDVPDPMFGMAGLRRRSDKSEENRSRGLLQLIVTYADGSRLDNSGSLLGDDSSSTRPLQAGHGGATRGEDGTLWIADLTFWASPLPPPGDVMFVCTWPQYGIDEARHTIEAQPILDAAGRAIPILSRRPGDPTFRRAY